MVTIRTPLSIRQEQLGYFRGSLQGDALRTDRVAPKVPQRIVGPLTSRKDNGRVFALPTYDERFFQLITNGELNRLLK